jgi:hypothetical protein
MLAMVAILLNIEMQLAGILIEDMYFDSFEAMLFILVKIMLIFIIVI